MRDKNPELELESELLTVDELAAYLQVHRTTIYHMLKARQLPGFRIGSDWRFDVEEINRWLEAAQKTAVAGRTEVDN
jgi:excisionase family DNA binding protein